MFTEQEVAPPATGEVTIRVHAAGVNPADAKHVATPRPGLQLPAPIGYEVAGVLTAIGPDTRIASGDGAVGDEVLAFRVSGGYTTELTVPASDVFAKPAELSFAEAANLLLAGTTASQMLHVAGIGAGDTILVHGASGAVGVSVLQQATVIGARVVGTASEGRFAEVRRFGGEPIAYGPGLLDRARAEAPQGYAAALDTVGTDEAIDVSLALVADRGRIVTIAAPSRAARDGFTTVNGGQPASVAYRNAARGDLLRLVADGRLIVPVARTYPLAEAPAALAFLSSGHPGGKLALLTE